MNKQRNSLVLLILLMAFMSLTYIFFISESKNSVASFASNGNLNLKNWDWSKDEIVELNGEWSFYPNLLKEDIDVNSVPKIEKVPGSWEDYTDIHLSPYGFCTYKLKVYGLKPLEIYGVELSDEATAYNLFANNKKIASNGVVSNKFKTYTPQWNPITSVFETDENGEVELIMEIANFDYYTGGFWNSIKIGKVEDILSYSNKNKMIDMFIFSTVFIIGLFSLGLFFIYRKDKTTLYFSVLCFTNSFRTLLINQRLISDMLTQLDWHMLTRLEFLTAYILLPIWGLFIVHLFEIKKYSIYIKRFFYSYILFCFFLTFITPNKVYSSFIEPNKWLSIIFTLYFLFCVVRANINRQEGAELMLYGVFGIIVSMLQEIFIRGPVSWLPFGSLNFVICCFLITLQQFLSIIRKNDILEAKVIIDPLTGLYNRAYINKIENALFSKQKNQNKYLMFLDLDRFKYINDTFGHKIGDFVLQKMGQRLRNVLKTTDIICRYGGDEFIIIVTAENNDEIAKITYRIINEVKKPFVKDENVYYVGISIGITKSNEKLNNIESLIKSSDEAMYKAKKNGGNQYYLWE
ncbi:GGDEF domain-containing protein [Clostridium aestuarii]|uniref:GGDEF domain-containing protein n=1 Tax=Clostridium aestuarii TaxID=338193 RepID=A0ABT4D1D2_9CLOT|nr:diguanylate cyclase [Clostridium aestuarii]MCY6483863.1 GGDEF domain-containing protein [Clostridium aestuarii]